MENNISVDTIEGNRLIAVFDGRYKFNYRTIEDIAPEKLKYRVSWDWLMPVVEKIEHCDDAKNDRGYSYHVCIFDKDCHIYEYLNDDEQPPIFMEEGKTKLEAAWLAVVEFIQWYNQTTTMSDKQNNAHTDGHWETKDKSVPVSAELIVEQNFEGLQDFIKDKAILQWYKSLIQTCMEEYAAQLHPEPTSIFHKLVDGKGGTKEILQELKQLHPVAEQKTKKVKCHCPCHKNPNIKHVVACCDNGYIEVPDFYPEKKELHPVAEINESFVSKEEHEHAINIIGQLQEQLKEANEHINDLNKGYEADKSM